MPDTNQGTKSAGSPQGSADQALPEWLQKLSKMTPDQRQAVGWSDQDFEEAKAGYMRTDDYTRKTQEIAPLRTLAEKHKDRDLAAELDRLDKWDVWQANDWPRIQQEMQELRTRANGRPRETAEDRKAGAAKRTYNVTADDFLETDRIQRVLNELEDAYSERLTKAIREEWYEKEEVPRLDRLAASYLATVTELIKPVWQKVLPTIDMVEVLRESVASQDRDIVKVIDRMGSRITETKKAGYDEGYEAGKKEAERAAKEKGSAPVPPAGTSMPSWKSPPTRPKTREDVKATVLGAVEKKYGPLPA